MLQNFLTNNGFSFPLLLNTLECATEFLYKKRAQDTPLYDETMFRCGQIATRRFSPPASLHVTQQLKHHQNKKRANALF